MWERPTTPFHRTNWVCGPTPVNEQSAGGGHPTGGRPTVGPAREWRGDDEPGGAGGGMRGASEATGSAPQPTTRVAARAWHKGAPAGPRPDNWPDALRAEPGGVPPPCGGPSVTPPKQDLRRPGLLPRRPPRRPRRPSRHVCAAARHPSRQPTRVWTAVAPRHTGRACRAAGVRSALGGVAAHAPRRPTNGRRSRHRRTAGARAPRLVRPQHPLPATHGWPRRGHPGAADAQAARRGPPSEARYAPRVATTCGGVTADLGRAAGGGWTLRADWQWSGVRWHLAAARWPPTRRRIAADETTAWLRVKWRALPRGGSFCFSAKPRVVRSRGARRPRVRPCPRARGRAPAPTAACASRRWPHARCAAPDAAASRVGRLAVRAAPAQRAHTREPRARSPPRADPTARCAASACAAVRRARRGAVYARGSTPGAGPDADPALGRHPPEVRTSCRRHRAVDARGGVGWGCVEAAPPTQCVVVGAPRVWGWPLLSTDLWALPRFSRLTMDRRREPSGQSSAAP